MPLTEKERTASFELGRLAGVAEEHLRGLQQVIQDHMRRDEETDIELKANQEKILTRLNELNNWRWLVVGIASAIAFVISLIMAGLKQLFK